MNLIPFSMHFEDDQTKLAERHNLEQKHSVHLHAANEPYSI